MSTDPLTCKDCDSSCKTCTGPNSTMCIDCNDSFSETLTTPGLCVCKTTFIMTESGC